MKQMVSGDTIEVLIDVQRQLMSDWSEDHWAAGWMLGIEEGAWHGSPYSSRKMHPYDKNVIAIHTISKITGVWCLIESTVPLDEWEQEHGPALTRMADAIPTEDQVATMDREMEEEIAHMKRITERFSSLQQTEPSQH